MDQVVSVIEENLNSGNKKEFIRGVLDSKFSNIKEGSVLHLAAKYGDIRLVELLVNDIGFDPMLDIVGKTPVDLAKEKFGELAKPYDNSLLKMLSEVMRLTEGDSLSKYSAEYTELEHVAYIASQLDDTIKYLNQKQTSIKTSPIKVEHQEDLNLSSPTSKSSIGYSSSEELTQSRNLPKVDNSQAVRHGWFPEISRIPQRNMAANPSTSPSGVSASPLDPASRALQPQK